MHALLHFLLTNGIGQNITAGALTLVLGWFWSKTRFWPLNLIHQRIEDLHDKHDALHAKHAELLARHDELMAKHEELHQKLDALAGGSGPDPSNS